MLPDDELAKLAMGVFVDAPLQVLIVDRECRIAYLSRYERGFDPSSVIGRSALEHIPEEHQPAVKQAVAAAFEGEKTSYETGVATPMGKARYRTWVGPLRVDGEIRYASMMSHDITPEYEARVALIEQQQALLQSEERFRLLVERAPEAIVIYDIDQGRFIDVNPRAVKMFGHSRDALLSLGPAELSPETQPDGRSSAEKARELLMGAADGEPRVVEWVHEHASGELIECEVRLLRLPDPDRRWVRGSITDISARKRAERENEQLAEQLAHAQRMQAVGQLTGGLAHDFNNLLTVIGASAALIEIDPSDREGVLEHARAVQHAVERAVELTQRMLAFSRQVSLRPRTVEVGALVRDMEELLERTLGETIAVETDLPADLWACRVDPAQLENALLNLAINARDAMGRGGRLRIAASNVVLEQGLGPEAPAAGDYVCLAVSDEGSGIPAEDLPKVVEPFFTTKEVGEGSGLGLSMVYGFAKQSAGHLTIDSEVGRGTCVSLYLPRSTSHSTHPPEVEEAPVVSSVGRGELVLVVEDEPLLRKIAEKLIVRLGFEAITAEDGPEAVAILEARDDIALLLSDMVLPGGMNGAEIGRRARELHPSLPVLYMSGYSPDLATELEPDATLIQKPFGMPALEAAFRAALGR